jgi:hypothetical protein
MPAVTSTWLVVDEGALTPLMNATPSGLLLLVLTDW